MVGKCGAPSMLYKVNRTYWVNFIFTLKQRFSLDPAFAAEEVHNKNSLQNESFKSSIVSGRNSNNLYFLEISNKRLLINRFGLHSSAGAGKTEAI